MTDLTYAVADGIGVITLDRPARKNAFTLEMIDRWADALEEARTDGAVRALVLTGAGDSFCAGVDLDVQAGLEATPLARKQVLSDRVHRVALAMDALDKPVIAAVRGPAVGAGMDMALMADIRIAGRSARFSEGYIRVGLVPGDGGCFYLPRLVGVAKALELLLTGDVVDGEEALRLGLVNDLVEDDEVVPAAMALARRLADSPPVAVAMIKRAVYQSLRCDLRTSLDLISSHMGVVQLTEDSVEAMAAFREKRPATFRGR